jgi:hypothetical protein
MRYPAQYGHDGLYPQIKMDGRMPGKLEVFGRKRASFIAS